MLGFSRIFIIFLIISFFLGYGSGNWKTGAEFLLVGIAGIIIWKILRN